MQCDGGRDRGPTRITVSGWTLTGGVAHSHTVRNRVSGAEAPAARRGSRDCESRPFPPPYAFEFPIYPEVDPCVE